jgi:hypothetical protein
MFFRRRVSEFGGDRGRKRAKMDGKKILSRAHRKRQAHGLQSVGFRRQGYARTETTKNGGQKNAVGVWSAQQRHPAVGDGLPGKYSVAGAPLPKPIAPPAPGLQYFCPSFFCHFLERV